MLRNPAALKNRDFDVLICGGGIYGAWTAYDAALRGLDVAVVDQGDWASATSSASSKLIHGGLRYLETLDIRLVRKALQEREMLLKAAPHCIRPLRFAIPLFEGGRVGRLRFAIGLWLYDLLAGKNGRISPHRSFSRKAFYKNFPFIRKTGLLGGFDYGDAQTDDARLVLELIDGASSAGAVCLNYCQVRSYGEKNGQVCSAEILDRISNETMTVRARRIVSATGQWAAGGGLEKWCRLSKGVHLVMPGILNEEAVLLTAKSDGRVFFLIPWYGLTLLGTTDTEYGGDIERIEVEDSDVDYLLSEANGALGGVKWGPQDVIGKFAGLRVLKPVEDTAVSNISRDWQLKILDNGVLHSIGGKITSARKDASYIVDRLCRSLGSDVSCQTRDRRLPWAPATGYADWEADALSKAEVLGIDRQSAAWLLRRHGVNVAMIFREIGGDRSLAQRVKPNVPLVYGDLMFCARREMVVDLEDLLRRRTPLLIACRWRRPELRALAEKVAAVLGWDDRTLQKQLLQLERRWRIP
ncbi:MAG: FAD-dependent oxidoreductase [Gammaproteobacteria bacterium]